MKLCDNGHGEVCFEGRDCPACEAVNEKDKLIQKSEDNLDTAKQEIMDLLKQVADLERQLAEPLIPAIHQANEPAA